MRRVLGQVPVGYLTPRSWRSSMLCSFVEPRLEDVVARIYNQRGLPA